MSELAGGPAARFFSLAQRCVWGVSQTDLVRVDVDRAFEALTREFPRSFVTSLVGAYLRGRSAPEHANAYLAEARSRCPADHPWRYLIPEQLRAQHELALVQVHAQGVFRVLGTFQDRGAMQVNSAATVLCSSTGELTIVNPLAFTPPVLSALRQLGEVRTVVVQGRAHSRFLGDARQQFPHARLLGTQGHLTHPASAGFRFDGLLDGPCAERPSELTVLPVTGTSADEVVLLHEPSRTLIVQDLLSCNLASHSARTFAGRLEYFVFGLDDRIGWLAYHPLLWHDLRRLRLDLLRILASGYEWVTGAHWPLALAGGRERALADQALSFAAALSRARHLSLVGRFVARQPGFLRDLIAYRLRGQ